MTKYPEAVLLPHVRLSDPEVLALSEICDQAHMLVLEDGVSQALPVSIRPFGPEAAFKQELAQAYTELQKLAAALRDDKSAASAYSGSVAVGKERAPLYDGENVSGILTAFRRLPLHRQAAGVQGDFGAEALLQKAALILLLSEDQIALTRDSVSIMLEAQSRAALMWEELKGGPDPLKLETPAANVGQGTAENITKRLAAWGLWAQLYAPQAGVYVTFDLDVRDWCLDAFNYEELSSEISSEKVDVQFYRLKLTAESFTAALAGTRLNKVVQGANVIFGCLGLK